MSSSKTSSTHCKHGINCWSKDCQYRHPHSWNPKRPQTVVAHHSNKSNPGVTTLGDFAKAFAGQNGAKFTNVKVSKPRHSGERIVISAETVGREKKIQHTVKYRPHFDVVMVLDTSSSMKGSPSQQMFEAVKEIFDVLDEKDGISIILFNKRATTVLNLKTKEEIEFPDCISDRLEPQGEDNLPSFKCSRGTALWDAILGGLEALARRPRGPKHPSPTFPHLVVITDGLDCSSKQESFESIKTMLHEPGTAAKDKFGLPDGSVFANFHATCITVGLEEDEHVRQLSSIAAGRSNVHHYNSADAGNIKECFREVTKVIERVCVQYEKFHISVESVTKYEDEITGGGATGECGSSSARHFHPKPAAGRSGAASVEEARTSMGEIPIAVAVPAPHWSLSARTSYVAPNEKPSATVASAAATGGHFRAHGRSTGKAN